MLYVSLVLSVVLLVMANVAVHRPRGWRLTFFLGGVPLGICPGLGFLPPVALLYLCLSVAMLPWLVIAARRWFACAWQPKPASPEGAASPDQAVEPPPRPWAYLPISGVAFAVAFGVTGWYAVKDQRKIDTLLAQYAFEPLDRRLPATEPLRAGSLPPETEKRLDEVEDRMDQDGRYQSRAVSLQYLHNSTIFSFVNSPGFGVTRMHMARERLGGMTSGLRPDTHVPQPGAPSSSAQWGEGTPWQPLPLDSALDKAHGDGVIDFANPIGFGYLDARRRVAGFQSHRFSRVPKAERWQVQRVDLVGLLLHGKPIAYVSANLPRMDELREAPTRPLDAFEASALERLRKGEDLVTGAADGHTRMVGAVRGLKQCVNCHGGSRGDLLGAFSYVLRRAP